MCKEGIKTSKGSIDLDDPKQVTESERERERCSEKCKMKYENCTIHDSYSWAWEWDYWLFSNLRLCPTQ